MISKEFFKNVELIAEEKNVDVEQVIDAVKKGLTNAYKKTYGNTGVKIELNYAKSEIIMKSVHVVVLEKTASVEEVQTENALAKVKKDVVADDKKDEVIPAEITLEEAKKIKSTYKVGDIIETPISPKEFGRIAASTGKQVFNQALKTIEKENICKYFMQFENEMIGALVTEIKDDFITLSVEKGVMTSLPKREMLPNDHFVVGDRIRVYLSGVESTPKGPKLFVSRSDKNLVKRLMENVIPEITDGTIEIMGIARDAGDRTKISVKSNDENVDPIGSCVGEGGKRIKEVVEALNGEKIDLYRYSTNPEELIANSLQPSDVIAVINVDPKSKTSLAIVPDQQLSLAIGKMGQNVRLAVQSCGWKIDIKSESDARNEGISF